LGSRLARLPKVGRLVLEEAPDALARLVMEHAAHVARLGLATPAPNAEDLAAARAAAPAPDDSDDRRRRDRGEHDRRRSSPSSGAGV
jgi:hypothetical protein